MSHNLSRGEFHFPWVGADKEGLVGNLIVTVSVIIAVLLLMGFQERQFQLHMLCEGLKGIFSNQNTHYLPPSEFLF